MKNIPRADSTQDNANKFQVLSVQFSAKRASISGPALGLTTPHPGLLPVEGRRNAEPRCRMFDRAGDFAAGAGPKNRMSWPTAGNLWRLRCGDIAAWKRRSNQVRSAECGITAEPGRRPALRGGGGQTWSNQFGVRNASTRGNLAEQRPALRGGAVKVGQTKCGIRSSEFGMPTSRRSEAGAVKPSQTKLPPKRG
jgi:hypothetical protein